MSGPAGAVRGIPPRHVLVVLGEQPQVDAFTLAGATVLVAEDPEAVRRQWVAMADDVAVVVLTRAAAAAVSDLPLPHPDLLSAVMP